MKTKMRRTSGESANRVGFTLVELLVVITIIGILAALITAAGAGALKTARQNAIKTELDQITMAYQSFKDKNNVYPPNLQVDGTTDPLIETQVLTDIKRAMKQAFPKHREPDELIAALAGLTANGAMLPSNQGLQGGMTAGESIVFWLGGFSNDPKFPISGEGGPSYRIQTAGQATNNQLDPVESRTWVFPFEVSRLQPRDSDNYFDASEQRFIEYTVTIPGQNNNQPQFRRINFWQYVPSKSEQPYLYFDVSRHPAAVANGSNWLAPYDPMAATELAASPLHVHAIKTRSESAGAASPIQFANPDKFQVLHCGVDGEWGDFEPMSVHDRTPEDMLLYPDGPFTGDVADTLTNFSEGTLEASQP